MKEIRNINILAIESSCDETAAAVVHNGRKVLSNIISSQIDLHKLYGGVVPEIASRKHIEKINQVIEEALKEAEVTLKDIDAVAVTYGPGLVGALLVGVAEAKAIAYAAGLPLVGVEGGKLRGEVAREVQGFGAAAREANDGVQLLLLTRYAKQAHGCRVLPGIGAGGYLCELQFHVCGCGVDAGREIQRTCYARQVALDVLYPVRGAARRLDDERQLPHLLLHHGGECLLRVGLYHGIHRIRKQPAGHLLHEGARTVHIARSPGDGGGDAGNGDVLRRVVDMQVVAARFKKRFEQVRGADEDGGVVTGFYRIACGCGQSLADAAPVGNEGNCPLLRMRGVVDGVFHVAGGKG